MPARYDVVGTPVDAVDPAATLDEIAQWILGGERRYVAFANVHGIMEALHDPALRRAYAAAGLTVPDGMPLVWMGRLRGHRGVRRVYGPDMVLLLCERAARAGWSCFFYGGAPGVAEQLASAMVRRFPGLRVAGVRSPPFRTLSDEENREEGARINASGASIVFVGLGCPKQEHWMEWQRPHLTAPVLLGVGAAFDFHTGRVRQAPRWMMAAGLEWLFRLAAEPRRLWRRYLLYNPRFACYATLELLGWRRPVPAGGCSSPMAFPERAALRLRGLVHSLVERIPGPPSTRPFLCPVCGHRVRGFDALPRYYERQLREVGYPYELEDAETLNWRQYTCRRCGASDRERLMALYLREVFPADRTPSPFRLVDFAPSPPLGAAMRRVGGLEYRTADLMMRGVDDQVDLASLPYADRSLDAFVCSHVLEHIPDDGAALRELFRVLKPGGWGLLLVPIMLTARDIDEDPGPLSAAERWRRFGQDDHVRLYSKPGFLGRVRAAGFHVAERGAAHFGEETFRRCGLTLKSVLYVVTRD
jgi:N-acetylglucosaminyldiphosphoundecaprenol N-acetyl-beta-D-mannosaminyltransferase